MDAAIVIVYIIGVFLAWGQISNGTGFFRSRMSTAALDRLNSKSVGGIILKIIASALLGYLVFAGMIIKLFIMIFGYFALFF